MHSPTYLSESYLDEANKQKAITFKEYFDLPKTTRQASLRIFKNKQGKHFIGKAKRDSELEKILALHCLKHKPLKPLFGPLIASVTYTYKFRKGEPKRNKELYKLGMPMYKRPDLDNLAKGTLDWLCKAGFFYDDSQIVILNLAKYWADKSNIIITLKPYDIQIPTSSARND